VAGGMDLRRSTSAWFAGNVRRLSLAASVERVSLAYATDRSG
jgi:hypothetical protein